MHLYVYIHAITHVRAAAPSIAWKALAAVAWLSSAVAGGRAGGRGGGGSDLGRYRHQKINKQERKSATSTRSGTFFCDMHDIGTQHQ